MNTENIQNNKSEYEDFLESVNKFNEIQQEKYTEAEETKIEKPVDLGNNETKSINFQNENNLEETELKENVKKIFTGEIVIDLVDFIFPKTMLFFLTFIDKDFRDIDIKKIQLDESEKEIYKPVGDYIAKYLAEKINPILFFSALYLYRTSLNIYVEYRQIKNLKKNKTMPLKRSIIEKKEKLEQENEMLKKEVSELKEQIKNLSDYFQQVKIIDPTEARETQKEIEKLRDELEILKQKSIENNQSMNTQNVSTQITAEAEVVNTKKRKYNISPEKLQEKLEKMKQGRMKKMQNKDQISE